MKKKRIILTSMRENAGKTSIILGLWQNSKIKCSYAKPMGDRLQYKKKRLWDNDSALITKLFDLEASPEQITIGFEHSKLQYMYDHESMAEKLKQNISEIENNHDIIFIESGEDLHYGSFVNLSAIDMAKTLDAKMIVVISGTDEQILDDLSFLAKNVDRNLIQGVILNKVLSCEDFLNNNQSFLDEIDINIIGTLPYNAILESLTVYQVCETMMAKVLTGKNNLNSYIKHIDVGSMSKRASEDRQIFTSTDNLVIISGDRTDIILDALKYKTIGIILTNGILPDPKVLEIAESKGIPLLAVHDNTFEAVKKVDDMKTLIAYNDKEKVEIIKNLIQNHVKIDQII